MNINFSATAHIDKVTAHMNTLPRLILITHKLLLIKPCEVLMFWIHMCMPLRRAQAAKKEVAKRTGRGLGAQQGHVRVNLNH